MLILTATFTRPNIMTPWYQQSDAFAQYFETTYRETGKVLDQAQTISEDGLTLTRTVTWATRADFLNFVKNDQAYKDLMTEREAHFSENGIIALVEHRVVNE